MSETENSKQRNGRKRAGIRGASVWIETALLRRPVQVISAAVLIVVIALLLGPSLGSESLAKKLQVGSAAPKSIKATRRFSYLPSGALLDRRRKAAAGKVLPVFDYQSDRGAILLSRINRAFDAVAPETTQPPTKRTSTKRAPRQPPARSARRTDAGPPAAPNVDQLRRRFIAALQSEVRPEVFSALHETKFSPDLRAAVVLMVSRAMEQMIIGHRGVLKPFLGRPIIVRYLVSRRVSDRGEEKLSNFARIKGPKQVMEQIRPQAAMHAAKYQPKVRRALVALVKGLVLGNVNFTFNQTETEARETRAQASIRAMPKIYVPGEVIIPDGRPVTKEHLRKIQAMEQAYRGVSRVQVTLLGFGLLVTILIMVVHRYAGHHFRRLNLSPKDLLTMGVLGASLLGLTRGVMALVGDGGPGADVIYPYLLPVAAGAMLVRLLIGPEAAALFAMLIASLCGLALAHNGSLGLMLYYLVTGLVGAAGMARVQSRSTVLRAGLAGGAIGALTVICLSLVSGGVAIVALLYGALAAVAGGVFAAFTALALLPALEWLFGYTTDVSLLELANLNHPLLRDLMLRAPGTYHHSMVVGSLSEAACEAIGADSLLAHVACNFHDVGKMKNAPYFAENFKGGDNPHNRLKPSMSSLIIRNHAKDTIELMREHGLPELVIETATQHHGTTLIEFFYHKAIKEADGDEEVHEEDYRYPGPKPQSREGGVLMLADGVEAAARSLAEPTEDRLRAVVQRVINTKFADGQLHHCDLTLRDLHLIAKSFLQVLRGIYHQRPTYPWQQEQREEERRKKARGADASGKHKALGEGAEKNGGGRRQRRSKPHEAIQRVDQEVKDEKAPPAADSADGGESKDQGARPGAIEPGSQAEVAEEGSPDIKRLGLN